MRDTLYQLGRRELRILNGALTNLGTYNILNKIQSVSLVNNERKKMDYRVQMEVIKCNTRVAMETQKAKWLKAGLIRPTK